ncbi:MAG TPA: redoxin family protein [Fimbriimonadaceae bacterium]|nr:redoxin family protein [Fimbriimonadaceae bacterium]HRJ97109.1 redoxin family protein [Fimbriimonadaceae bacterium]
MNNLHRILLLGSVAAVAAMFVFRTPAMAQKTGSNAPDFKATGTDGKPYTLKSFTGKKATLFYFIGSTCPVNAQAVKYFNRVATAYKGSANFVGVIDGDKAAYTTWNKQFKAPYLVLLDPKMKIIEAYGAERSPWAVLVDAKGKITKIWTGYSAKQINEIGGSLASASKVTAKKIDVSGAPDSPRAG